MYICSYVFLDRSVIKHGRSTKNQKNKIKQSFVVEARLKTEFDVLLIIDKSGTLHFLRIIHDDLRLRPIRLKCLAYNGVLVFC